MLTNISYRSNFYLEKKQLSCLGDILSDVADEELRDLPPYATRCSSIYIPEVGYLLGVTLWRNDLTDEDLVIPNLDFRVRSIKVRMYKHSFRFVKCKVKELRWQFYCGELSSSGLTIWLTTNLAARGS